MKPYLLVLHNKIRTAILSLKCHKLNVRGILMLRRNTKIVLSREAVVDLGDRVINDGHMTIIVGADAKLSIGERTYFNEDAMISCKQSISIGSGCKFGPNVKIFDNNHRFSAEEGVLETHDIGSIHIGDGCWIGSNVVILKGASIGDHTVIGAGCIVDCEIPPKSIVTQGRELSITPMR